MISGPSPCLGLLSAMFAFFNLADFERSPSSLRQADFHTELALDNVIFEVPHDGFYSVGVANYLAVYNALENRLQAKIGWVEK